jgi:hypothetical protein
LRWGWGSCLIFAAITTPLTAVSDLEVLAAPAKPRWTGAREAPLPACLLLNLTAEQLLATDEAATRRVLQIGPYVVGEADDPHLSGHPNIRY